MSLEAERTARAEGGEEGASTNATLARAGRKREKRPADFSSLLETGGVVAVVVVVVVGSDAARRGWGPDRASGEGAGLRKKEARLLASGVAIALRLGLLYIRACVCAGTGTGPGEVINTDTWGCALGGWGDAEYV